MARLTDNDRRWGPLTWGPCGSSWRPLRLVFSTGGDNDYGRAENNVTAYAFGWVARLSLPTLMQPWREWVDTSKYEWSTNPKGGYWDVHAREYGFSLSEGFLQLFLGPQTGDSTTTKSWSKFLPWTQWRHVRFTLYDLDGHEFWTQRDRDAPRGIDGIRGQIEAEKLVPKAVFRVADYDGEANTATVHITEREWRFGTGWFKWLSLFRRPMIRRSLSINFAKEIGTEKGSWKGGLCGTGIDMLAHETVEDAFRRFCEQEQRGKYGSYRIEFLARARDKVAA